MQYFRTLEDDLTSFSLRVAPTTFGWNEYDSVAHVMQNTGNALHNADSPYLVETSEEPITRLGKTVLALHNARVRTDAVPNEHFCCCDEAEWKLTESLHRDVVSDPRRHSPILASHNGKLVAVGKHIGEPSWYGLADAPALGIYAGTFMAIPELTTAKALPRQDTAYQIEVPTKTTASILRFGLFATPLKYRQDLRTFTEQQEVVVRTTHRAIVERCTELSLSAAKIEIC